MLCSRFGKRGPVTTRGECACATRKWSKFPFRAVDSVDPGFEYVEQGVSSKIVYECGILSRNEGCWGGLWLITSRLQMNAVMHGCWRCCVLACRTVQRLCLWQRWMVKKRLQRCFWCLALMLKAMTRCDRNVIWGQRGYLSKCVPIAVNFQRWLMAVRYIRSEGNRPRKIW